MNATIGLVPALGVSTRREQRSVPNRAEERVESAETAKGGSRAAFTLLELLVVIGIIGILAGLLLPALAKARSRAKNIVCISQLKQLGLSVRMYADDHQNRLPSAEVLPSLPVDAGAPLPRICDVLSAYAGGSLESTNQLAVFKCPTDIAGRFTSEGSSYEWNTDLNGRRMDETRSARLKLAWLGGGQTQPTVEEKEVVFPPEHTPLLLDYEDFHPRPPKSGKNVVFLDGHVTALELPE